jgi:hypothetical protein
MDQIQKEFQPSRRNSDVMTAFGYRLHNQFTQNEAFRRMKEIQWLEDLRAYKGIYDPEVKIEANNSKVYPKITRSKVNIVLSRLHEMLFPETDKNWEIMPTPEPKVSQESLAKIIQSLQAKKLIDAQKQMAQQGGAPMQGQAMPPITPITIPELKVAVQKFADETCANMSNVIDDQLTEMDYAEEVKKVLRSGLLYGTGIMKGPMINKRSKHKWEPGVNGEYVEAKELEEVPYFKAIRIWDWYPDMTVTDREMMEGSFERHLMTKHDLRELIDRPDYYGDIIKDYLRDHPSGDYVAKNWEVDLQTIEVMAASGRSSYTMAYGATDTALNGENRVSNRQIGKKYQVLEFWGYVDGTDLEACGVEVPDVSLEYAANVFLLGNKPIKAVLFEGALDMYKLFYYEKDETSLMGEGLARVMRHSQLGIAAGARMVLDNGACVCGPQVEVNWSLMTPNTDFNSFYPRKIWYREGRGVEAQYPALRDLSFDSHIPDLLSIIDAFKQFADEETTLPTWMIGQMVNNETAQATSGRQATITVSIKDIVKNFDSFTEGIIRDLYAWNMEFNARQDIKGDFNVKARGVSSLVMKEIRMQALSQFMTTVSPEDWVYLDRRELLHERLKAHDLNVKLKSEDEAEQIRQEQQNSVMNQLQIEAVKAEIAKDKAQAMSNLTKAKEKNILANKEAQTPPEQEGEVEDERLVMGKLQEQNEKITGVQLKNQQLANKIRMEDEDHTKNIMRDDQDHYIETAKGIEKHKKELELKEKTVNHGMKMKEMAAKSRKKASGVDRNK